MIPVRIKIHKKFTGRGRKAPKAKKQRLLTTGINIEVSFKNYYTMVQENLDRENNPRNLEDAGIPSDTTEMKDQQDTEEGYDILPSNSAGLEGNDGEQVFDGGDADDEDTEDEDEEDDDTDVDEDVDEEAEEDSQKSDE